MRAFATFWAGIMHRDLKPANILIFSELTTFRAVIADLGSAAIIASRPKNDDYGATTIAYAPPEFLKGMPYDASIDLWALVSHISLPAMNWTLIMHSY